MDEQLAEVTDMVLSLLVALNDSQRRSVFERLRSLYCQGCGMAQSPGERSCQCQNDE